MILPLRNGSLLLRRLTNSAAILNTCSNRTLFRAPRHRSITGNKYAPPYKKWDKNRVYLAHEAEVFEDIGVLLAIGGVIILVLQFKMIRDWYEYCSQQVYQHEVQLYDEERQKKALEEFFNSE